MTPVTATTQEAVLGGRSNGWRGPACAGRGPGLGGLRVGLLRVATRAPSARAIRHEWLTDLIRQVHQTSRGTYGVRRVHAELVLGHGFSVGHGAVEMLMRRAGIAGVTGRPKWRHNKPDNIARDLVDRAFARSEPNQLWVTDITEHPTREGKLYCCVVLDTFSRRVVGWSIDASPTAALVTNAVGMAIDSRRPQPGAVIHSDQGVQFASWAFTDRAKASGLVPSMGSVGDCYDNSMIESFFAALKNEMYYRHSFTTRARARFAVAEYIEVFYNRRRLHSTLGYRTPFEALTNHQTAAAA